MGFLILLLRAVWVKIIFFLEREGKEDDVFGVGGERRTNWVPKNLDESVEFEVEAIVEAGL